jgi:hypothetical protein
VPEDKKEESKSIIPQWEKIEKICTEIETTFFEKSEKEQLSPYDMSIIVNRLTLLFEEFKLVHFMSNFGGSNTSEDKTIGIHGKDSIYR